MPNWEHKVRTVPHRDGTYSSTVHVDPTDKEALINEMGQDGWEHYETEGSILTFKRPIEAPAQRPETPPQKPEWLEAILAEMAQTRNLLSKIIDLLPAMPVISNLPRTPILPPSDATR